MPRVKPLAQDPRESAVLDEMGAALASMRISKKELAKRTGIEYTKLCRRFKSVGEMRLSELWAIQDARKRAGV